MKCPTCGSTSLRKNGRPNNRQRYRCKDCGRQFMAHLPTSKIGQEISVSKSEPTTLSEAPRTGIAILLLDVENLKIDVNTEQFLASISEYSLQVKMAFANWKNSSLSKYDAELFERGYQLIHVPEGKNSADAQMISMGAAIGRQYSDAKAVFVCSSDWLLTHLCNSLQNQGLTVYRVRRQPDNILSIENRNTLEVRHYSLKMATEIPPLEEFVEQIQQLLQVENESISRRSSELSIIASLLEKRCEISLVRESKQNLSEVVSEDAEILAAQNIATELVENEENIQSKGVDLPEINSRTEFEQEVMKIISNIPVKKNQIFVDLNLVDEKFMAIFGEDMGQVLKDLKINNDLENFFKFSAKFRVKKKPRSKEYKVANAAQNIQTVNSQIISSPEPAENVPTINSQIISSPKELEQALVNIIEVLAAHDPHGYICISIIGTKFKKQYSHSITTILKQLKLSGKFLDFLKSSNTFNLKKVGNKYQVAIADKE
ncbi:NYN domain-containing protein [Okeania sp. SIO2B3]|uniref:IS1/IS1595 family N-terminal zinc-binding domain-containing protein n=1 Tax=Okeania sp. SIO2B3 TaxID=2607784 RepID=UPI0013BF8F0E|nr:NYN domain-containing protein [Okeania sp. SIO2B3]NET45726.1 NYN domain-containing protein [Okeania sp. SIO2B3]